MQHGAFGRGERTLVGAGGGRVRAARRHLLAERVRAVPQTWRRVLALWDACGVALASLSRRESSARLRVLPASLG